MHKMPPQRRYIPLLAFATFALIFVLYRSSSARETWRTLPQHVGMGESIPDDSDDAQPPELVQDYSSANSTQSPKSLTSHAKPNFQPGTAYPPGHEYTRILVIPRTHDEDISWISEELPEWRTAIYTVDDPLSPLHPPKNKGHEVMVYLSWIIDSYDALPDVAAFMHAHRWSWHNDDILDNDAAQMLRRLSSERVMREGYMNMRCHWDPGCPDWMHPGEVEEDINKQEQTMVAKAWSEIFPLDPIPDVLAQACCAQFALSKERIRSIPLASFVWYRDWLLKTQLSDYISGRIWEYMWQYIFTGQNVVCPAMHQCYCDGFGVCFGGEPEFNDWFELRYRMRRHEDELREWHEKEKAILDAKADGKLDEAAKLEVPESGRDRWLQEQIDHLRLDLEERKQKAFKKGEDPRLRAEECGREWKEGDGF
ncbi:hypothetical protein H2201_007934 [Coniosporium apollinis]|uniref:Uncharacterized protein n=1 Tax=Coniosporium apollinis TaxID=61459 RepID=A0ABQ9NI93_9PEZI|nr:hypothetical protein H2201_007934 [Coniosporium apollinis]